MSLSMASRAGSATGLAACINRSKSWAGSRSRVSGGHGKLHKRTRMRQPDFGSQTASPPFVGCPVLTQRGPLGPRGWDSRTIVVTARADTWRATWDRARACSAAPAGRGRTGRSRGCGTATLGSDGGVGRSLFYSRVRSFCVPTLVALLQVGVLFIGAKHLCFEARVPLAHARSLGRMRQAGASAASERR